MIGQPFEEEFTGATDLHAMTAGYLAAADGDRDRAPQLAVSDLLKSSNEAALAAAALDQWTSRGYVRGRATERLGLPRITSGD